MDPITCSVPDCPYVTPQASAPQMISLLTLHTNAVHIQQPAAPTAVASKLEKLPRPVFSLDMTESDWQFKEIDWNSYIEQTSCSDNTKLLQLRAACDDSLRQRVCDSGGWNLGTVPLLLARIKELAVVKIHKSRHLANLYDVVQQPDESVRAFVARLTGTADMCGMQVQCTGCQQNVSYRDEVVKQMIIHGLVNCEIKQRVLSRTGNDELPTLAELVNYIAAEEISCSESFSVHSESNTVGHVRQRKSSYKRNQGQCSFCGDARHSSSNSIEDRRKSCRAFGTICPKCGKPNHFSSVCQSGRPNSGQISEIVADPDYEGSIGSITAASLHCGDAIIT